MTFRFFDVENLAIESERGKVCRVARIKQTRSVLCCPSLHPPPSLTSQIDDQAVTLRVKPGETTPFVDLVTKDPDQGWHYNYDPSWEAEDTPAWM